MSYANYQYGSDPRHRVILTPEEAWVVNNIRLRKVPGTKNKFLVNLNEYQMGLYARVTEYLNGYLREFGPINWDPVEQPDVLIPIK